MLFRDAPGYRFAYAVGMLQRCYSTPTEPIYAAALRVLKYLERFADLGLTYDDDASPLRGVSDSDWPTRRATSGYVFHRGPCAISWTSSEQSSISLSSCEAEIMAASGAASEAIRLADLLAELGFPCIDPVSVGVDNKAARDLAYNPEHHDKTKHIPREYFNTRALIESHRITVLYVSTVDNMADFFTKPLKADVFSAFRNSIMHI